MVKNGLRGVCSFPLNKVHFWEIKTKEMERLDWFGDIKVTGLKWFRKRFTVHKINVHVKIEVK